MANHKVDVLKMLKRHAIAVITVDPNGKQLSSPILHPDGEKAPFKLIALVQEDFEGGENVLAEIGVRKTHPYRWNYAPKLHVVLRRRLSPQAPSVQQVRGVTRDLTALINGLVEERSLGWKSAVDTNWHHRFLRGVSFSINLKDEALCRFFEEWESVNPALHWRLDQIGWAINRSWGRNNHKKYPKGFWEFSFHCSRKRFGVWASLLRPHVAGALALRLKYPVRFLEFLVEQGLITARDFQSAVKVISYPERPIVPFSVLPSEVERWTAEEVHGRKDSLSIICINQNREYRTFMATMKMADWARRRQSELEHHRKRPVRHDPEVDGFFDSVMD